MKKRLLSTILAVGAVLMYTACSDSESPLTPATQNSSSSVVSNVESSSSTVAPNPGSSSSVDPGLGGG